MRRTLLNDIVFKIVFGSPKNERVLRSLLNAILDLSGQDKIVHLTLLGGELSKAYLALKGAILDVRARDGMGRQYNIEVQLRDETRYVERSLYYLSKLYSDQLERGEEYDRLRRTVAISILDFSLFPEIPELHTRFRFCDLAHNLELSDILEIHYLELTKFRRDQPLLTPLEKWLHVLKFAELYGLGLEELPGPIQAEEDIIMALDAMNSAYASDEVRDLIEGRLKAERDENSRLKTALEKGRAEGRAEGRAQGLAEGLADGRAEGVALSREKIAHNLLKQGMDPESIYKATGVRLDPRRGSGRNQH